MTRGRRDLNHAEIRDKLRDVCGKENVRDTANLGHDFPDLVVGYRGQTYLLEIKSSKSAKLRAGQAAGMSSWRGGPWVRVNTFQEALMVIGVIVTAPVHS